MNIIVIDPTTRLSKGIDTFVNLAHHFQDDARIRNELELIASLDYVKQAVSSSATFSGNKIRTKERYSYIQDAKEMVEEVLLNGNNMKQIASNRRKHAVMHHLVIEPLMASLSQFDRDWMIANIDSVMDTVIEEITKDRILQSKEEVLNNCNIVLHTSI